MRKPTEREIEIGKEAEAKGIEWVCNKHLIAIETAKRYRRIYRSSQRKEKAVDIIDKNTILQQIAERYSQDELKQIANGQRTNLETANIIHDFKGEVLRIGVLSDTHIGSVFTDDERILMAFDEFEKNKVDIVTNSGDVTEGLSNRPGHMLECSEIGYERQQAKAIDVLSQWNLTKQYMISGNHDRWYMKSAGANIVKNICNAIPNAEFIGDDEGNIQVGSAQIRLWHGLDGSSYAHSYRLQKLIESLTGGDKPSCLIAGHVHKMGYFFDRHIHCISAGCIQRQTSWMRGKRLAAHTGFWIIELVLNETGIARCKPEFYPFYV